MLTHPIRPMRLSQYRYNRGRTFAGSFLISSGIKRKIRAQMSQMVIGEQTGIRLGPSLEAHGGIALGLQWTTTTLSRLQHL
jgi:hypothetical protein